MQAGLVLGGLTKANRSCKSMMQVEWASTICEKHEICSCKLLQPVNCASGTRKLPVQDQTSIICSITPCRSTGFRVILGAGTIVGFWVMAPTPHMIGHVCLSLVHDPHNLEFVPFCVNKRSIGVTKWWLEVSRCQQQSVFSLDSSSRSTRKSNSETGRRTSAMRVRSSNLWSEESLLLRSEREPNIHELAFTCLSAAR